MDDRQVAQSPVDRYSLELALFGTGEPLRVERILDEYCRREVGAPIKSVLFHRIGVASVHGAELTDGRQAVVKAHRPVLAWRLEGVQQVQSPLARQGFPSPRPLVG